MKNSFSKSILATCLAGFVLLTSLPASAVLPSDISGEIKAAQSDREIWEALGVSTPGVYRRNGRVFSYASVNSEANETHQRHKARTEAEAIWLLVSDFIDRNLDSDSIMTEITRHYLKTSRYLSFKGRIIQSGCEGDTCRVVFCVPATELEQASTPSRKLALQNKVREAFAKNPAAHPDILKAIGAIEPALLSEVRALPTNYANVFPAVIPTKSHLDLMSSFQEKRTTLLKKLAAQAPTVQVNIAVALANEDPVAFRALLDDRGIKPAVWLPSSPILAQVAAAQGFVVIDERAPKQVPAEMSIVKDMFAKGKKLPLTTHLLERAAEAAPRNAEVWEYLAAAYHAAGKTDQARICARVWFLLSDNPAVPLKYILSKFDVGENDRRLAAIL